MDYRAYALANIEKAHDRYRSDLESLSEDQLANPIGQARTAYDFTHEVAHVNRRVAARIRGDEPAPAPDGWITAPENLRSKAACIADLSDSVQDLKQALEAQPDFDAKVTTPNGEMSVFEMANFMGLHMMYHDAQLNYIQSVAGDGEVHW